MHETEINQAGSLVVIEKLVTKCQRCSLYQTKIKDVPGVGDSKAEVLFIGEAPGKDEDRQGEPFVGAAGKFLNEMIESIGWHRQDVYITNVVKHRPPGNRDPLPAEIEACWPYLAKQIELIEPKLIVFLGRYAMNRFFPTLQISKVHGQAFRRELFEKSHVLLALYHPAAALYNGSMRDTLLSDFQTIPKILEQIKKESLKETTNNNGKKQEKLF